MLRSIFEYCNYEKTCLCEWNQCVEKMIDIEHFWQTAKNCVGHDVCGRDCSQESFINKTRSLYNTKTIVWTKCGETYVFIIGFDPINEFHVQTRLEHTDSNAYIDMNVGELDKLFSIIEEIFEVNISYPSEEKNIAATIPDRNLNAISIVEQKFRKYRIRVGDNALHFNEHNLLNLLQQRLYFTTLVQQYESERVSFQNNFLQLLTLCCKHLNSADFNQSKVEELDLSSTLMEILKAPCSCAPQSLIIETATHFSRLLKLWIPIYWRTQLLSETIRSETFKKHWPHKFIDGKLLAKFGFYYTGSLDKVKCIFCGIILCKWMPADEPLNEHLKYAPHCPLMNVNIPCRNISELSTDIDKLLLERSLKTKDADII